VGTADPVGAGVTFPVSFRVENGVALVGACTDDVFVVAVIEGTAVVPMTVEPPSSVGDVVAG
jgi:hypothetical protein